MEPPQKFARSMTRQLFKSIRFLLHGWRCSLRYTTRNRLCFFQFLPIWTFSQFSDFGIRINNSPFKLLQRTLPTSLLTAIKEALTILSETKQSKVHLAIVTCQFWAHNCFGNNPRRNVISQTFAYINETALTAIYRIFTITQS